MGIFQHDMTADHWTLEELIANLRLAVAGCDERRSFFHSVKPDGSKYATWKRHMLAVAAAIPLLNRPEAEKIFAQIEKRRQAVLVTEKAAQETILEAERRRDQASAAEVELAKRTADAEAANARGAAEIVTLQKSLDERVEKLAENIATHEQNVANHTAGEQLAKGINSIIGMGGN